MHIRFPGQYLPVVTVLVFIACAGLALPASGQTGYGAIDGAVKDESGGVLPGVSVEATSPALIEGSRAAMTDSTGTYKLLRLPVGEYTVTFSLSGFATVRRTNVVLTGDFTATINVVLRVATLEEALTVTAETPMVDVRTTMTQTVVTDEVINTIPSSRNVYDMAKFVIGGQISTPDVGGAQSSVIYSDIKVHGSRSYDRSYYIDGLPALGYFGQGDAPFNYGSTGAREEVDYQTTALPAWIPYGGVAINTVSKSGGDSLHGDVFASDQVAQSSNLDDDLRSQGVRATSGSKGAYDFDGSLGGPIKKGRFWFFGSFRVFSATQLQANSFFLDGTQAYDYIRRAEWFARGTWQVNPDNKLTFSNTQTFSYRPYRRAGATFVQPEATLLNVDQQPNYFPTVAWTMTHGSSLVIEIQGSPWGRGVNQEYRPEVGPNDVAHLDFTKSILSVAPGAFSATNGLRDYVQQGNIIHGSVTRVGSWYGYHELRTGFQSNWGHYANTWVVHGDITQRYSNGVPNSVDLLNTPAYNDGKVRNIGIFVQDAWRVSRVTINAGLRYDDFHTSIPAQSSPSGTWVGAREYAPMDVKTWRTLVPRLGMAFDLTGDARTVLKGSFSKYVGNEGLDLANRLNPLTLETNRCAWRDLNNDDGVSPNEISSCAGWPGGSTTSIDPNLRRPFAWEYSVGVQRQLGSKLAGSVMYFRRENRDNRATKNLAVPHDSYIPIVITNPLDNTPLTIYNQNPSTAGRQQNVLTNSSKLDTTFNGIDLTVVGRFSAGTFFQAGYSYGKDLGRVSAGELNDPNNDIFNYGAVGTDQPHQFKLSGAFTAPGQITVSTFLQAYMGNPRQTTLQVTRALVPTLTRATQTVNLEPNNVNRYPSVVLLDLRLGRVFKVTSYRFEIFADAYNLLNDNTVLGMVNTYGPSLGNVSLTVSPRLVRLGGKFSF